MKKLTISKGFYFSCGDKWWPNTNHGRVGLGIEKKWLLDDKLIVNVDKVDYELDCQKARDFIKENQSWEDRKNARIGYIPKTLLYAKTNSQNIKNETVESDSTVSQANLW